MMSESDTAINVFSTPTSSSRLSPLATPFSISNPFNRHESFGPLLDSSSVSTFSFDQPFPYLSLGSQGHHGFYGYHSDTTSITAFPYVDDLDFETNSLLAYYPLQEPPVHSHFTLPTHQSSRTTFIPSSTRLGHVGHKTGVKGAPVEQQGRELPHNKDQIRNSANSLSCNNLLERGPLMTWSHCDSTIITTERCFPHHGSCGAETLVSCAAESFSCSTQFKPSSAPNPTIINSVPLENMGSASTDAVSDVDYVGHVVPSLMDTDMVQNLVEKVACHDQVIVEKGESRKIVEPFHDETENPSIMAKSKLQIACVNVLKDLTLEQHGAKAGIPDDKSSTNHDDSDVDSPCWKGTLAYNSPPRDSMPVNSDDSKGQSPPRVSVPLKSEHSKNEKVARNSLNPLAPVFIPGNSKRKVDYHQQKCPGDSSSSSQNIAALAVTSSSIIGAVKADICPSKRNNDIGIHCSNDAHDSRKEYGVPYKTFKSSLVNSFSFQPYLREGFVTSQSQLVRGTNVAGSMEGTADATHNVSDSLENTAHNGSNTSISFLSEFALSSHSIGVGISSDFTERLQEPSKSTPPKVDVKLIINTIQYLSQLLLQSSSFYSGSLTEHEHDKLLYTINNLYVVIRNEPELHHLCTLYGQRQAADDHEVAKVRDKAILRDREMHETSAPMLSSRMLHSFHQGNGDEGFKKGNDNGQVIEKDPKVINSIDNEMPPEALFL